MTQIAESVNKHALECPLSLVCTGCWDCAVETDRCPYPWGIAGVLEADP